jgi:aryl-alcohol dehydrogenase-like predicted oxidoreductase
MLKRKLGRSSLEIAPLVLGGNVFGWTIDEPTSFRILDAALDAGINCVDTADLYSRWLPGHVGGESEVIIGNWLARRGGRDRVIVATKLGLEMGPGLSGLSPAYIRTAVDASLRRLQTDYIDLYQAHVDDADTPIDDVAGAFDALIKAGKVRAVGASNFTAQRLTESLDCAEQKGLARYEALQPLYNLHDRSAFEDDLQQVCLDRNVGVITYSSLASGFLTGKYRSDADRSISQRGYAIGDYLTERGMTILAALDQVAAEQQATPAEVALAWLMQRPAVTAPIASATSLEQLAQLIRAVDLRLTSAQVAALDHASAPSMADASA